MKMSWVTIDRFCREETEVNDDVAATSSATASRYARPPNP